MSAVSGPIEGPTVWTGAQMQERRDWIQPLSAEQVEALDAAVEHAMSTGKARGELTAQDFPLGALESAVARWMWALEHGPGFVLARGVPVWRYTAEQAAVAYWGLGLHMGRPVSQNAAGDLLGHVRDTGEDPSKPSTRGYKTREALSFHCDGSDIVGLLCFRPALSGGESQVVSAGEVYNELLRRRPDLVPLLYRPFHLDRNDEQGPGEPRTFQMPICFVMGGALRVFYVGWYIRSAQRHPEVPRLTPEQLELLDLVDQVAGESGRYLPMDFQPGDIQWLKNSAVLHARAAFEDHPEPQQRRHLLRLWLAAHRRWAESEPTLQAGIPVQTGARSDEAWLADDLET